MPVTPAVDRRRPFPQRRDFQHRAAGKPERRQCRIDAVGTGFPGIPRNNLMVLPEAEWQKQKERLIYDAWASRIRAIEEEGTNH